MAYKGGGNFPGIAFSNFLVDIIHGLTLNLDSHEEKEARTLRKLLKGQLVLPRLLNHAQNCLNNVFINLNKKLSPTVPIKELSELSKQK